MRVARRNRRWLGIAIAAWIAVLVVAGVLAAFHGQPTAREQTSLEQALPVLTRSASELAWAASADDLAVVAVQGIERYDCDITTFRAGARYRRVVLALVAPGSEAALIERVADRLPDFFQPRVRGGDNPTLTADAGLFVAVTGTVAGPGQVTFVSDTGDCRDEGRASPVEEAAAGDSTAVDAALARLAANVQERQTHVVSCPSGGQIETVQAVGRLGPDPVSMQALLSVATGELVGASDEMVAFRTGDRDVAVRLVGDHAIATATRRSCG